MTATVWWLLAAALAAAVVGWLTIGRGARAMIGLAAVLTAVLVLCAGSVGEPRMSAVHGWLIGGLGCVLGAALVNLGLPAPRRPSPHRHAASTVEQTEPNRPVGLLFRIRLLISFAGLGLFAVASQRHSVDGIGIVFGLVLALLTIFAFGYRVIVGAEIAGGPLLATLVGCYMAALGSMVVLGVATASPLIAYGCIMMALSDIVLAGHLFVIARSWAPATVAVTAQLSRMILVIGLLR
jgi:hypothetical protein